MMMTGQLAWAYSGSQKINIVWDDCNTYTQSAESALRCHAQLNAAYLSFLNVHYTEGSIFIKCS